MGMPSVLKHFNLFNEARSYQGEVQELKLPKLTRKMEEYRGGGMGGPVKIDLGQEIIELEHTYGGLVPEILKQYGTAKVSGFGLRFAGSYEDDGTGTVRAVEIIARGRHEEIDMGDAKGGDMSKTVVKTVCSYYKLSIDNQELIEIDHENFIFKVNGVDQMEAHRKAIGLS